MWSIVAAQDALSRHQFIKISLNSLPTRITVQDLPQLWGEDPTAVAHTGYRIAGSLSDVTTELQTILPAEQLNAILGTMLTKDNYSTTMAEVYRSEQEQFTTWNRDITLYQTTIPGQLSLFNIVRQIDPSVGINTTTGQMQKKKGVARKSLQEKIANLGVGRVLDVSKLQEDGTGYKTVLMPKNIGYRFYVSSLPMISDDLTHYLRALSQLPGGYHNYLSEIAELNRHNAILAGMQGIQPISLFDVLKLPTPTPVATTSAFPTNSGFPGAGSFPPLTPPISAITSVLTSTSQGIMSTPTPQSLVFPPTAVYYPPRPRQ